MLDALKQFGELLLKAGREERPWLFSHLAVPGVVLALIFFATGSTAPILDLDSRIAVVPLKSSMSARNGVGARPGMAIILEPHAADAEYVFPWRSPDLDELWTSLDLVTQRANTDRLTFKEQQIDARAPFLGESQPVVIVVNGESAGDVLVFGKRIPLAQLQLAARRSAALAMWVFVAAIFAAALTSISIPTAPAQQSG